jgi:hypothetical protein
MPYNGSGTFSIVNSFVPNTTILSSAVNQNFTDIATGLSDCLTRDGQAGMTAALAMGNNKITGLATPTLTTDAATKAYVDSVVFTTGDVKLTMKIVADAGWLLFADQTIGNVGSGATFADATALNLYTLLWTNVSNPSANAWCFVTGGLGANAAADWAGLKRMALPIVLGRALAAAGSGSGLTARTLGSNFGVETRAIAQANLPSVNFSVSFGTITTTLTNSLGGQVLSWNNGGGSVSGGGSTGGPVTTLTLGTVTGSTAIGASTAASGGSGTAFNLMNPGIFLNAMIKL